MNQTHLNRVKNDNGFIAALDQSGGSTPKALAAYGVEEDTYDSEDRMFELVHEMRTRIITSSAFHSEKILGAILFEQTMDNKIDGQYTSDYLISKDIVPFLKIDKGLAEVQNGVQLMKPMPDLDDLLKRANQHNIFGTKMRSNIVERNEQGIKEVVKQQFDIANQILDADLVPIIEPEVNINVDDKKGIEEILKNEILNHLNQLSEKQNVMLKLTIPTMANDYKALIDHPRVLRVVALSGGYSRDEATAKLKENDGLIASFSRALTQDLRFKQSDELFDKTLQEAVDTIYEASIS